LWSLRAHFKQLEIFAFSTIIKRITEQLADSNLQHALSRVSSHANHWSGGTKIGHCLQSFLDKYGSAYLNGRTITLFLSDGLDTGDMAELESALEKIKLKSKQMIWLNPLKGMVDYEPIQAGMKTAMPKLDHFGAAHNLNSLMELEKILFDA